MNELYTNKVRDRFISPQNLGALANPSGVGEVGNVICGDTVKMFVKLADGKVADAKYQTYGCVYSIACADMTASLVKGQSIDYAEKLTGEDVAQALDGLPDGKVHCSVMAVNALRSALKNAGENVDLLAGAKEITTDMKKVQVIPLSIQQKHRIAELFDEFFIPELKKKSINVELVNVDISQHTVQIRCSRSTAYVKSYIEGLLKRYVEDQLSLLF